jgi:hypothetical protein
MMWNEQWLTYVAFFAMFPITPADSEPRTSHTDARAFAAGTRNTPGRDGG